MAVTMMRQESGAIVKSYAHASEPGTICELRRGDENEVLEFLSARPLHTVFMAGLINDNGLISPQNRGSFYGCRGRSGQLEGVALVGHATIIEAGNEGSITSFAHLARRCQISHFIFFQAEDGIRYKLVTGVQTCALPICGSMFCRPWTRCPRSAGRWRTRWGCGRGCSLPSGGRVRGSGRSPRPAAASRWPVLSCCT